LNHSHKPDTGRKVGLVLTDSSAASPVGIQSLRTVARQHAAYFNCSDCQRGFPQSSNMSAELATWMLDTLVHLAGHWSILTAPDTTDED